ncbi:MAG: hypothetical protein Q9M75_05540 [Ghiorsea sp.]|nr:hypothetical protein [Ghiorsea sp.]
MSKHGIKAGNGNQISNRDNACVLLKDILGAEVLDRDTVNLPELGERHISCYTDKKRALIRNTDGEKESGIFGFPMNTLMVRLLSDGRLAIYDIDPEKLKSSIKDSEKAVEWSVFERISDHKWVVTGDLTKMKQLR